jgi:hypothetical protein
MSCARLLFVISILVGGCVVDERLADDELALEASDVDGADGADDESRTNCELILFGIAEGSTNQAQTPPPPPPGCQPDATLSAGASGSSTR